MKKKFACLFLLLFSIMSLGLAGCHGSKNDAAFTLLDTFDEEKNYEITFWAKNDTNKTQTEIYNKAIEDFQKIYPNITVNLRLYNDYSKIYNDVITNISTDTTPNVCVTYPDHIATYISGGSTVVPLDELMSNEQYGLGGSFVKFDAPKRGELFGKYLEECAIDGVTYALPYMRSSEACYINKDMLEKLGYEVPDILTWDFIWEVSEKAIEKDASGNYKLNGQKVLIPFIYKSTDNMMIQYLKQKGAGYSTEDGDIQIFNEETKKFLYEIGEHAASGAFSTFVVSSYPGNFLNAGQCIFAVDSTAGATWMGCDAPLIDISPDALVQFETVVRPVPQVNPDELSMISQGPSVCIFNKKDTGEVMASWLFLQYLLTNDVQIAYASTEGYLPVTKKAVESAEYNEYLGMAGADNGLHYKVKIDATKCILENVDNTFVTPVFKGSAGLRSASGQMIENVVKAKRRKQTVDEAWMEKMQADVTGMYHLNEASKAGVSKVELGKMPVESNILLAVLALVWTIIIIYVATDYLKRKKSV